MADLEKTVEPEMQETVTVAMDAPDTEVNENPVPESQSQNVAMAEESTVAEESTIAEESMVKAAPLKKTAPRKGVIWGVAIAAAIAATVLFVVFAVPAIRYSIGVNAYNSGNYDKAVKVFSAAEGYKEADDYLIQSELGVHYSAAGSLVQEGEYKEAIEEYIDAKDFQDSKELLKETYILYGDQLVSQKQYDEAIAAYRKAKDQVKIKDTYILHGDYLISQKQYDEAITAYGNADDPEKIKEAYNHKGEALFQEKKYIEAADAFASAENSNRRIDCGITLIAEEKNYADAVAVFENDGSPEGISYRNYANGMLSMESGDYQMAVNYFAESADVLEADAKKKEATFLLAEKCLNEGYLNKANTLYASLPEDFSHDSVTAAERLQLLKKNQKLLDLVGTWNATKTYYKVRADSTTSSYYYYWYQDSWKVGTVTVTCPYNGDGSFTIKGSATFPSYQNFSTSASQLKTDMETFEFSKRYSGDSIPKTIGSSSTTKLTFNGKQFNLQYKYVNKYSNVYWSYTFTSKETYGKRTMLPADT